MYDSGKSSVSKITFKFIQQVGAFQGMKLGFDCCGA